MATKTFNVSKQMMVSHNTGHANPGDLHIPIGRWDSGTGLSWNGRATLYAPVNFSGMVAINEARLYLRAHWTAGWHAHGTSTATLRCKRKTDDWSETSHGSTAAVDELWGGDGTDVVGTGLASFDGTSEENFGNLTEGNWYDIPITEIVDKWFTGSANYGVMLYNETSETNDSFGKEFYSRHVSGSIPYIWVDYSTNTAPNPPVNLSPTGNEIRHTGTTVTCSGTRSDPDSGDYIHAYRIQVFKDDGVTLVADSGKIIPGGTPTTFSRNMSIGANPTNAFYKWKGKTWDKENESSSYSSLQRFKLNTAPNTPSTGSMSVEVDTLTPVLSGPFSDPDPNDTMSQVQIEVVRTSDSVVMWSSGDLAATGSSWSKTYSGTALAWSTQYKFRARVKDSNGSYSSWSGYVTWTTAQPTGPTQSPRTSTAGVAYGGKINDTTPDLTITYSENFTDHEIFVYSDAAATNQVFSSAPAPYTATTSKVVTCTTVLTNGATYYWKARVFIQSSGTWSQWAGFVTGQSGNLSSHFYVNALPTAATDIRARSDAGGELITRSSDGIYIVTRTIPQLEADYSDPDIGTYGDAPSARSIEIYNNSTGSLVHSSEDLAPTWTIPMKYFPGTISGANTTLAALASAGATNLKVTSVTSMAVNDFILVGAAGSATLERVQITSVGTSGSGGTGINITPAINYDHANAEAVREIVAVLANETTYKMRWRFQDNSDTYGSWSSYVVFKVTQPSAVGSLTPNTTVTSPAFTATWSHTSPGSKAQGTYQLTITRDSDSEVVYDTGEVVSSAESHAVPGGFLTNGTAYTIAVDVVDTDGV